MPAFIDLTGKIIGRLEVVERAEDYISPKGYRSIRWKCKCKCGNIVTVRYSDIKSGRTLSCGCLHKERAIEANFIHGMTNSRLHQIWNNIKDRVFNHNCKQYKDYGGRGISICNEWKDNFTAFRDWAYSNGYQDDLMIDRINNDDSYSPCNCRWVDRLTQNNNTRKNVFLTFSGKKLTVSQWARELGVNVSLLRCRLKRGWTVEDTLSVPKMGNRYAKNS